MTAPTLDHQIAELKRELALRKNVYPKFVAAGKMRQSEADLSTARMTSALHTVMAVKRLRATMVEHQYIRGGLEMCICGARADADPFNRFRARLAFESVTVFQVRFSDGAQGRAF